MQFEELASAWLSSPRASLPRATRTPAREEAITGLASIGTGGVERGGPGSDAELPEEAVLLLGGRHATGLRNPLLRELA